MRLANRKPNRKQSSGFPDFLQGENLDFTHPYPCHVCKVPFRSRHALATHKHPKKEQS